jgi:hypothetical protein
MIFNLIYLLYQKKYVWRCIVLQRYRVLLLCHNVLAKIYKLFWCGNLLNLLTWSISIMWSEIEISLLSCLLREYFLTIEKMLINNYSNVCMFSWSIWWHINLMLTFGIIVWIRNLYIIMVFELCSMVAGIGI